MRYRYLTAFIPSALCLMAGHDAWADAMRCGDSLVEVGKSMATVQAACGNPADVQHSLLVKPTSPVTAGDSTHNSVGIEIPVEVWTYDRGPNQFMVSIRFVDGKVTEINTLHEYGH